MNNADLNRMNSTKNLIRSAINYAVETQNITQKDLLKKLFESVDFIYETKKTTPKHIGSSLRDYMNGYLDAKMDGQTVFLYNVDGTFYSTKAGNSLGLPCWDTLPREQWDTLGEYGGTYWVKTLNPYFVR